MMIIMLNDRRVDFFLVCTDGVNTQKSEHQRLLLSERGITIHEAFIAMGYRLYMISVSMVKFEESKSKSYRKRKKKETARLA